MIAITVRFQIKTGCEQQFLDRVRVHARTTLSAEPGCRQFDVCRNPDDASVVSLYELYEDPTALDIHVKSPHLQSFNADTRDWLEQADIKQWERLPALD